MTRQEILQALLSNISDEYDKSVGSFFYDALMPVAIQIEKVYSVCDGILPHAFAKTASGSYLDNKVAEQGLVRKAATKATGTVTITGTDGSAIKIGDKVASDTLTFTITENAVVSNQTATVTVECDTVGAIGNVPIGSINHFPVTLSGLVTVTNTEATNGRNDTETDDELRERYFNKVSRPSTSGNIYDYIDWAREIAGIGDARAIPLWNGNGTVKVIVISSSGTVTDETLLDAVRENIEAKRPVGAEVTVESATPLMLNISVKVSLKSGVTLDTANDFITSALTDYLKGIAFRQDYISYAYIGSVILNLDEILDYMDLTINNDTSNISVQNNEVAVLGTLEVVSY